MMHVVVVDTGLGNVRSVVRALERAGARAEITRDVELVARADALVVPGQGAFRDCARALEGGLGEAIRAAIARGTRYLGICLGMQALFDTSNEAPGCAGLGVFRGNVARLPASPGVKIPHTGWNEAIWRGRAPEYFYFTHSYAVVPEDETIVTATTEHGRAFVSAISKDNITAVQFHPEKSQRAGHALLERFLS